jgi:hypothetical protein
MLPAHLHIEVARDCIVYKKSLVTVYILNIDEELDAAAEENNLVFKE